MCEVLESHLAHTMCLKNISSDAIDYCLLPSIVIFGWVSVHFKPGINPLEKVDSRIAISPDARPEGLSADFSFCSS